MLSKQEQSKKLTLKIYLYYRLVLGTVLYLMLVTGATGGTFGAHSPTLFSWACLAYIAIALLSLILTSEKFLDSINRMTVLLASDLIVLTILIHASDGLTSGLGYLLVVSAAIASIFIPGRYAIAFASLICFFLIGESIYLSFGRRDLNAALFSAGTLGFLVFITAFAFQFLTERIRASTEEAQLQKIYARRFEQLAQNIVTRMRTGVVVVDANNTVELINQSALQLLNLSHAQPFLGKQLDEIAELNTIVCTRRDNPDGVRPPYYTLSSGHDVRVNFSPLDDGADSSLILYLEDYRSITQHAQQLKLASLGRLAASIAHEIRNPLGAISHAAQLLSESEKINAGDARLCDIIVQHSQRVNQIIENTLVLSKRKGAQVEYIELHEWLPRYVDEYLTSNPGEITIDCTTEHTAIKFDPTHLRQILTNLLDNGLRFSKRHTGTASVHLNCGFNSNSETTYLEVIDNGPGIPQDTVAQAFEPFFTTDDQGSGLGLYISRELCEINQASLRYLKTADDKSRFIIHFSHYQRMI